MRFLFVSAQLPGHLDWGGYLATAVELKRRGHAVLWASGEAVRELATVAGVDFHALVETGWRWPPPPPLPPNPELDADEVRYLRGKRALDQWLDANRVAQAGEELLAVAHAFGPDVVVSETFVSAAGLVAEALSAPLAIAGWPAMAPRAAPANARLIDEARTRLQRLLAHFSLQGVNWSATGAPYLLSPHLHITYWSPRWYAGVELLPQTVHVGGRAQRDPGTAPPGPLHDPWVFVTLGTSFGNDANFFRAAAQAAVQMGCQPIIALGGQFTKQQTKALRAQLPPASIVAERVDFAALLPHVSAAIHHGGAGTTHALVTHAVPQIVVPHAGDQIHQAQGVVRSGVGLYLAAKEVRVARLVNALAQLLPDLSPARANAKSLREEFASLDGTVRAAALLEELVNGE